MNPPRPRVVFVRSEDPQRGFDDPGLAALAAAGWTVGATNVVHVDAPGGNKEQSLMILMWPPADAIRRGVDWIGVSTMVATVLTAVGTWALVWVLS